MPQPTIALQLPSQEDALLLRKKLWNKLGYGWDSDEMVPDFPIESSKNVAWLVVSAQFAKVAVALWLKGVALL